MTIDDNKPSAELTSILLALDQFKRKPPAWLEKWLLRIESLLAKHTENVQTTPDKGKAAFYTITSAARTFKISRNKISAAIKLGELATYSNGKGRRGTRMHPKVFEKWYFSQFDNHN